MNTDNTTISGETIDYGPCAFMDRYDPATVFSSIDHGGRYAYGNQPAIVQWNLARLAEALLPLIDDDLDAAAEAAMAVLRELPDRFRAHWSRGMAAKLGLEGEASAEGDDPVLFDDYLRLLHHHRVDLTSSFRLLADLLRGDDAGLRAAFAVEGAGVLDDLELGGWLARWRERALAGGREAAEVAAAMDQVNPVYVPRNHLVDEALTAATAGDLGPYEQLLARVTRPYDDEAGVERYAEPAPDEFTDSFQTFCGT